MGEVTIVGIEGIPEIRPGDNLAEIIVDAVKRQGLQIVDGDILVVTSKIVSKAENRLLKISDLEPSCFAVSISRYLRKDSVLVEAVLREARRLVRMARDVIIAETRHGFVCANAGVDQSNIENGYISLLPSDPDRSARRIRNELKKLLDVDVAVVISDTFGRPWREGQTDVAIGISGIEPIKDYRGLKDTYGYELKVTAIAVVDEIASAAELVMGKLDKIPAALIRGYSYQKAESTSRKLIRKPSRDLFR